MKEIQFSAPNVKIRVKEVKYGYAGSQVHCFLTFEQFDYDNPYSQLVRAARDTGMTFAIHPQYKPVYTKDTWRPQTYSGSNSYIYEPTMYEYHGTAVLKVGDINDIEFAKAIAYRKAYRQFVGFYYACYLNLYERVMAYANDVWYNQIAQLSDRYYDVDKDIKDKIG